MVGQESWEGGEEPASRWAAQAFHGSMAGKNLREAGVPLKPQVAMDKAMGQRCPIPREQTSHQSAAIHFCVTWGGVEPGLHPMTRSMKEEAKADPYRRGRKLEPEGTRRTTAVPIPGERGRLSGENPQHPPSEPALRQQRGG